MPISLASHTYTGALTQGRPVRVKHDA